MGYKFLADQNQLAFFYESGTYADQSYVTAGSREWIGLVQDHTPDEGAGVVSIRYQGSTDRNSRYICRWSFRLCRDIYLLSTRLEVFSICYWKLS